MGKRFNLTSCQHYLALESLQTAYDLSLSNHFIMPFVELGNHMLALVKMAVKQKDHSKKCNIPHDWLTNIQRKTSAYAKKNSYLASRYEKENASEHIIIKTLTTRELEFLQDLCKGLSRSEIAADRNVSEHYVKLAIQNIYSKLHVNNLKEAIRVAASHNLI